MFELAIMPTQNPEEVTILARTEEWARFIDHLRASRNGAMAAWIELDPTQPINKIKFSRDQGDAILGVAGIAY